MLLYYCKEIFLLDPTLKHESVMNGARFPTRPYVLRSTDVHDNFDKYIFFSPIERIATSIYTTSLRKTYNLQKLSCQPRNGINYIYIHSRSKNKKK